MWDIFCPPTAQDTEYLEAQEGLPEAEVIMFSQQFQVSGEQLSMHAYYTRQYKVSRGPWTTVVR